jgi:CHAD domain-containing protein
MNTKVPKLARKRLERFATLFAKALVNDAPDTIHDLRVASRRLQQTLRAFLTKSKPSTNRKLLRLLRKVRRAFGACRNLDVTIALIEKRRDAITAPSLRRSWKAVSQWLEGQRAKASGDARDQLKRCDLTDFVSRAQTRIDAIAGHPKGVAQLWQRAGDALAAWKEALAAAKADPQIERIHGFRIAGKRLRYRVESLAELGDPSVKPLLQGLKALQNDLGDWHDRKVLQQYVADFIARPGFLAQKPGLCRALLIEMERDKQRDQALINEVVPKAEQLAEEWSEIKTTEGTVAEGTTDQ